MLSGQDEQGDLYKSSDIHGPSVSSWLLGVALLVI